MKRQFPARSDDARERLRIESIRMGAHGTAIIAAGGSSFLFRSEQAQELGLSLDSLALGLELDEAQGELLVLAAEAYEAEQKAYACLARAEQSVHMLSSKLEAKGYSRKAARLAVERLQAEGLLSDRRFADAYAASRLSRRAEGPASLVASLRGKGVDGDTAKTAVASLMGPDQRRSALVKAAEKETRRSGGDREAVRRRLKSLGFKSDEISEYFDPE